MLCGSKQSNTSFCQINQTFHSSLWIRGGGSARMHLTVLTSCSRKVSRSRATAKHGKCLTDNTESVGVRARSLRSCAVSYLA